MFIFNKFIYPKNEKKDKKKQEINIDTKIGRFNTVCNSGTFFTACTIVAHIIVDGGSDLPSNLIYNMLVYIFYYLLVLF